MEANQEQCELTLRSASSSSVPEPRGLFLCVYCDRKFYNWQAFGGHQNAHKEERSLARRRRDITAGTRAHSVSLSTSAPSLQDTARLGVDCPAIIFPAPKKARMETQLERGRSFPDYGGARTGDGLDLSLRL